MIDASTNSKYQELFLSEAQEHLDALDANLIEFEKDINNTQASQELMRHAHTLKGMAASMGYGEISNLSHSFEGMIENIKNGVATGGSQLLFGAVDELRRLVAEVSKKDLPTTANPMVDKVGELENDDLNQDKKIAQNPEKFHNITEIKVKTEKLNNIMDVVSELTLNKMRLVNTIEKLSADEKKLIIEAIEENTRLVDELQYQTIQLRLMPLLYVFNRFPRMIRDLAKKENKIINFVISGDDLELDRSIIDIIGEPLVHLLRNAVDHGIKKEGKISLSAQRQKDKAIITIEDTGVGIDWKKLREKAATVNKPAGSEISDTDLLFAGISTTDIVTDVSGRGVGMSIVKNKIESLGGKIEVESIIDKGTTFKIILPISLAIIKVLLIDVKNQIFAIPLGNIERLIDYSNLKIQKQGNQNTAVINDSSILLIELSEIFNFEKLKQKLAEDNQSTTSKTVANKSKKVVILIKHKESYVGFIADKVLSQQDMVVKPLSKKLRKEGSFSAMTILGNGIPVPILDTESIINKL